MGSDDAADSPFLLHTIEVRFVGERRLCGCFKSYLEEVKDELCEKHRPTLEAE